MKRKTEQDSAAEPATGSVTTTTPPPPGRMPLREAALAQAFRSRDEP